MQVEIFIFKIPPMMQMYRRSGDPLLHILTPVLSQVFLLNPHYQCLCAQAVPQTVAASAATVSNKEDINHILQVRKLRLSYVY